MLNIYLCEDDKKQLDHWEKVIQRYLLMHETEAVLHCAVMSPYELLNMRRNSKETGLYFLDIDLKAEMNGIELAREIRRYDPRGYIVFVTTHDEMAVLTYRYKVEAMDFIIKGVPEGLAEQFFSCIHTAILNESNLMSSVGNTISIKLDGTLTKMNEADILVIESSKDSHKVMLHTASGVSRIPGSLKEMEAILSPVFIRCSQSAFVNVNHVKCFASDKRLLIMDNGKECRVSIRMLGVVKKIFWQH